MTLPALWPASPVRKRETVTIKAFQWREQSLTSTCSPDLTWLLLSGVGPPSWFSSVSGVTGTVADEGHFTPGNTAERQGFRELLIRIISSEQRVSRRLTWEGGGPAQWVGGACSSSFRRGRRQTTLWRGAPCDIISLNTQSTCKQRSSTKEGRKKGKRRKKEYYLYVGVVECQLRQMSRQWRTDWISCQLTH